MIVGTRNTFTTDIRYPIIAVKTNSTVGVVGIIVDLFPSQELIQGIKPYNNSGDAILITHDGTIAAHGKDIALRGKNFSRLRERGLGQKGYRSLSGLSVPHSLYWSNIKISLLRGIRFMWEIPRLLG
ncbi:MAG: hypothetical protein LBD55_12210 [Treponema sp.]|jgi:hypothetical protein|nr:hypothetical protein [Treponema sp.]